MLYKQLYFIILIMLFTSTHVYAQQIIDGSFENNTAFNPSMGVIDTNEFKQLKCLKTSYSSFRWQENYWYQKSDDTTFNVSSSLNLALAPHGKTFIIFGNGGSSGNPDDSNKLALWFTSPLIPNNIYTLRWASGPYLRDSLYTNSDSILIELGTNILYPTKQLYVNIPIDYAGYRYYSITFKADSSYTNIFFSRSPRLILRASYKGSIIDNVQIDTCVVVMALQNIGCASFPVVISATNTGKQVLWNTGDTTRSIQVTKPGYYTAAVFDSLGCVSIDSIFVTADPFPIKNHSSTTSSNICNSDSILLSSNYNGSYIWNTGDNIQNIWVKDSGTYWVRTTIQLVNGCTATDSFIVKQITQPSSSTFDTFYCAKQTVELSAPSAASYLWNSTEQTQSIKVNTKGMYWVTKTNQQCSGIDTFLIAEKQLPIIQSLKDTTVCFAQVAQILLDAGKFKSYLWQPTGELTQTIYSTQAQVYLLTVTDSNNCSTSKQVAVMETCPNFVYIPTAFTPNGDGINDVFLPKTRSLETYQMSIINQWGAIIFTNQNTNQGWDGKDAPAGVYIAIINYKATGKAAQTVSQNITLLR